jgi:hypothetical protein
LEAHRRWLPNLINSALLISAIGSTYPSASLDWLEPRMGNLPFWLGLGAAQKSAGSKELKPSRHRIISLVVGILIALAIVVGMFFLLVSQQ